MDDQIQRLLNELSLSFDQETFLQLVRYYQRAGYLRSDFINHYLVRFCSLSPAWAEPRCQNFILISEEAAYDFAAELLEEYLPRLSDSFNEFGSVRTLRVLINQIGIVSSRELVNNYNIWVDNEQYREIYQISIDIINDAG